MDKDNNKPKIAVALQYEKGEQAPKILATGKGYLAEILVFVDKTDKLRGKING